MQFYKIQSWIKLFLLPFKNKTQQNITLDWVMISFDFLEFWDLSISKWY
jgi:hypothetical protein